MMPRYKTEQADDGRWLIAHGRDDGLAWNGDHWTERDSGHALAFGDQAAAERYAAQLFGNRREP